ncbi:MAG: hypothetical protein FWC16_02760 [Defluviitaleaceae bacterium]|nr:hypothetical protein [Defluviitaleaceae bacterium]MCL2273821.1 hypothetical protein [Defluviitaleaceae bacterium]
MRYAYVTFLMRGDSYLPGALVLAYALKMQSQQDCICLVTHDVSHEARKALHVLYDAVIPIDALQLEKTATGGRSDRKILPTRFQALRLCKNGGLGKAYDKIILLDADVLPLCDYDSLFRLNTPAGILMENKNACYSHASENTDKWNWHTLYDPICPHGTRIPAQFTNRVLHDPSNMGVNAGLWVLAPSMPEYEAILHALPQVAHLAAIFPWPEQQLATLLWSGRWTNVDIRYNSIGGYPRAEVLKGIHYAGVKPWQWKHRSIKLYSRFADFKLWYTYYNAMYVSHKAFRNRPALVRLWKFIVSQTPF